MLLRYEIIDARHTELYFKKRKPLSPKLIITSPPYHNLKNYDNKKNQMGYKQTYDNYLIDVINVLKQCFSIAAKNSTLWLVVDTIRKQGELKPLPFDIINKLSDSKSWKLRDIIIWNKKKNIPWHAKGRFKNSFEYILFFSKGSEYKFNIDKIRELGEYKKWFKSYPERYSSKGQAPSNIWEFNSPLRGWGKGYQKHLCPFPFELIERIISLATNEKDLVFDPFVGSGSVLAIANLMNRKAIGFDLSTNYRKAFEKEVKVGAKKFFEKSEKESVKNKKALGEFKKENIKLRKVKAAVELSSFINKKYINQSNRFFVLTNGKQKELNLYFVTDNIKQDKSLILMIETLKKRALQEYKLKTNIHILSSKKFSEENNINKKLYLYAPEKIHQYEGKLKIFEIMNGKGDSKKIYSDLPLSIS
ncbi:MAG: site-specific DNA-methyltransferase [Ignavibacteriales bacterium]|nr:site-specific DNA-methyltransferase [Ignavibacteriales bacterium]